MYNALRSQVDGVVLKVLHFVSLAYKSTKHYGLSFACYGPMIWSDLPVDKSSATSVSMFGAGTHYLCGQLIVDLCFSV